MAINVKDKLVTLESLGVAYSAEQDAREEADQALSTRIDNIVAPDGDPSLTEVSDARVSGSTTYNTLKARLDADKAAIGTEISQLSADLDNIIGGPEPANYEEGKNLDASGNIIAATGYNVSDFIPYTWTGNSRYYVGDNTQQTYRVCFYDENKAFIKGYVAPGTVGGVPFRYINVATQVTGGTCAYVRFSFKGTDGKITSSDGNIDIWVATSASTSSGIIGDLTNLNTTNKENLVGAINSTQIEAEENSERLSAMSQQVVVNSTRQQATFGEEMISDFSALTPNGSETYADGTWNVPNGGGLSTTLNVTANTMYFIQMTVSSATISDGSSNYRVNPLVVSLGDDNISMYADFDANWKVCLVPSTGGEVTLSLQCAPVLSLKLTSLSVKPVVNLPVAPLVANSMQLYAANNLNGNSVAYGGGQSKRLSSSPNTAFGYRAQLDLDTAVENTAVGYNAQRWIRNGRANTGIGNCSQQHLTTGMYNNAIGTVAQGGGNEGFTGCWNNALGNEAQRDITSGCNNVAIGRRAQSYITTGNMNIAVGAFSGFATVGHQDGSWGTKTSNFQTLVGGETTQASANDTDYLIAIGYRAKGNEKGIALGALSSALGEKSIAIGYGVTASADNQIVIGENGDSIVLCGKRITFNADHTVTWEDVN